MSTCHVVTHVHWDREWYRPFEAFRSRLVELVEHVCAELESGRIASFHLDGQTATVADVLAVRPDLEGRLREHVEAGRLTVGPWHVLADNQLVSAENLVRNLLLARRWSPRIGGMPAIGYSPDAFGHPADLPRVLRGFGIDTALVWRGAPPGVARFRWRSPDGSEVFAVRQRYHEAEVLWPGGDVDGRLASFLDAERLRLPEGPWLLLNGGDHLAPSDTTGRLAQVQPGQAEVELHQSTLVGFFAAARAAAEGAQLPVVDGELRAVGDRLTFLLPGTLSVRSYLKQAAESVQVLLERFAEPAVALAALRGDARGTELLQHAWELAVLNSPHDSICGCSVDEVHSHCEVRAERATSVGEQLVARGLLGQGMDVRGHGEPAADEVGLVVVSGTGTAGGGPLVVDVVTAPDRHVVALTGPDGEDVPVEVEDLGVEKLFEADLDLMPETRDVRRHRLALVSPPVPGLGWAALRVRLGADAAGAPQVEHVEVGEAVPAPGGRSLAVASDGSFTVVDGRSWTGLARLVDGGDAGDTYTYEPPVHDELVVPRVVSVRAVRSAVRTRLVVRAELDLPAGLTPDRTARSAGRVVVPVTVEASLWAGRPELGVRVSGDSTAEDHRLRLHVPVPDRAATTWTAEAHWSTQERPLGPPLGPLPTEPALEAPVGVAPVHGWARCGAGERAVALLPRGLPEVQGLEPDPSAGADPSALPELAVALLRGVGWLSRFDLRARTAGAGPMLATPGAQARGPFTAEVAVLLGEAAADDAALAQAADRFRAPLRGFALRPGTSAPSVRGTGVEVWGARVSALKPAEDGDGAVLRLANPTPAATTAVVTALPGDPVEEVRLDEVAVGPAPQRVSGTWRVELAPFAVRSFRLRG